MFVRLVTILSVTSRLPSPPFRSVSREVVEEQKKCFQVNNEKLWKKKKTHLEIRFVAPNLIPL